MELIGVEEIMEMLNIGRPMATRLLQEKSCPTLPRYKGQKYRVIKNEFIAWFEKWSKKRP